VSVRASLTVAQWVSGCWTPIDVAKNMIDPSSARRSSSQLIIFLGFLYRCVVFICSSRSLAVTSHKYEVRATLTYTWLVHWTDGTRSYEPEDDISDYAKAQYYCSMPGQAQTTSSCPLTACVCCICMTVLTRIYCFTFGKARII